MTTRVTVDPEREPSTERFEHRFRRCVGTGRVDLALHRSYMQALEMCQREIGFSMIRGHGILSDQAGAVQVRKIPAMTDVPEMDPPLHNFTRICRIIDNWLSAGIEPFVELGFMPSELASGPHTVFWWKSNVTPPARYSQWNDLVSDLVRVLLKRYGAARVRSWPFEVWNEPDVGFWRPEGEPQPAYFELYRNTVNAVKAVDADIQVGGPATCPESPEWVKDLVDHCVRNEIPIDFASTHLYMIKHRQTRGEFFRSDLYPLHDRLAQARRIRGYLEASAKPGIPLHITEWNTSYAPLDLMHETTMNAAYVAWVIAHMDSVFDSYSYWTFSDVFEECGVASAPFHGGFGLVTEDGVRKPTFFAFAFAAQLGETVHHRSDTAFVTSRADGTIAALLYNPCLTDGSNEPVEIVLDVAVPWQDATVVTREVNDDVGTGFTVWKSLGRPRYPSEAQMDLIRRAQYPRQAVVARQPDQGRLRVTTTVPPNGITLVEIMPREDGTSHYRDLPAQEWGYLGDRHE
jgi:xylan 1,4-beta-xylosidase